MVQTENQFVAEPNIRRQLMEECQAMAEHAFAHGLSIPEETKINLEYLDQDSTQHFDLFNNNILKDEVSNDFDDKKPEHGKYGLNLNDLIGLHAQLSIIVSPAKPHTLRLFAEDKAVHPLLHAFGDCALIRKLGVVCVLSLMAMLAISLSPHINGEAKNFSLTESSGLTLFINEIFLLSAASLGAAFSAMFRLSNYIVEGSYDTKYDTDYWAKYMLGVVSGAILALMIPVHELVGNRGGGSEVIPLAGLAAPLLALLGGFSSSLVHRVLNRLVLAFETVLRGDVRKEIAAKNATSESQAAKRTALERQQWSLRILRVIQRLYEGEDKEKIRTSLEEVLWLIMGESDTDKKVEKSPSFLPPAAPREQQKTGEEHAYVAR